MPLTWASLEDSIPPLNLLNFPAWQVLLEKKQEKDMHTIELTDAEYETLHEIIQDYDLIGYLVEYNEEGELEDNIINSLFTKLGIDLTGEEDGSN